MAFLRTLQRYSYARQFSRDFTTFSNSRIININFTRVPNSYIANFSNTTLNNNALDKPRLKYKAVIGDLGNTIIPGDPMIHCMQLAFYNVFQMVMHHSKLMKAFGDNKARQIQALLFDELGRFPSDHDVRLVETEFTRQLVQHYKQFGVGYLPGTLEGLRILHRNGIAFGCTTGLNDDVIAQINKCLTPNIRPWPIVHAKRPSGDGIREIVQTWNFGKPYSLQIKLSEVLKVGDSESDWWEAKEAGVDFIAIVQHRARAETRDKEHIAKEFQAHGALMSVDTLEDVAKLFCPWHRHGVQVKK